MSLREKVRSGQFVITAEVAPPKGADVEKILEDAEALKGRVDAVNVTDMQSAVMKASALPMCALLKERGHEPVFQITCRDRNRLGLQADLLGASLLGIENVLIISGDHPKLGDHPQAKPVYDLDAVQLLAAVNELRKGRDMAGKELKGVPNFFAGAAVNPGADPLEPEIIKTEKKIKAGAEFFQTQAVFDVQLFQKFIDAVKGLNAFILAGIVLLKSAKMARFMNKHVSGVNVPDSLIEEMEKAEDKQKKSVEIAARLINELKGSCQGIHIMPLGWDRVVPLVLDAANL